MSFYFILKLRKKQKENMIAWLVVAPLSHLFHKIKCAEKNSDQLLKSMLAILTNLEKVITEKQVFGRNRPTLKYIFLSVKNFM